MFGWQKAECFIFCQSICQHEEGTKSATEGENVNSKVVRTRTEVKKESSPERSWSSKAH